MKKQRFDALYQTKHRLLIWHRGRLIGEVFTLQPIQKQREKRRKA